MSPEQSRINFVNGEVNIQSEGDIVLVRKEIRDAAKSIGFDKIDITRIVTASSELARNIFKYAGTGKVLFRKENNFNDEGIVIEFVDSGPGIEDIEQALQPGFSTSTGLGMGLTGSQRLMDSLMIESSVGRGTKVTVAKWKK